MLVSSRIQLLLSGRDHTEGSRVEGERERERKSERNYRVETGKKRRHYWKTEFSEIERGGGGRGSEGRELILP